MENHLALKRLSMINDGSHKIPIHGRSKEGFLNIYLSIKTDNKLILTLLRETVSALNIMLHQSNCSLPPSSFSSLPSVAKRLFPTKIYYFDTQLGYTKRTCVVLSQANL